MTNEEYIELHQRTIKAVLDENYYSELFCGIVVDRGYDVLDEVLDEADRLKIYNLWDDFWYNLPDSPEIRTGPFFDICNLCENY